MKTVYFNEIEAKNVIIISNCNLNPELINKHGTFRANSNIGHSDVEFEVTNQSAYFMVIKVRGPKKVEPYVTEQSTTSGNTDSIEEPTIAPKSTISKSTTEATKQELGPVTLKHTMTLRQRLFVNVRGVHRPFDGEVRYHWELLCPSMVGKLISDGKYGTPEEAYRGALETLGILQSELSDHKETLDLVCNPLVTGVTT